MCSCQSQLERIGRYCSSLTGWKVKIDFMCGGNENGNN